MNDKLVQAAAEAEGENLPGVERCSCGHEIVRDHKETMRGERFCYLCSDASRCVWPKHSDEKPTP